MNKERIIFSVFLLLLPVFFTGCNRQEEPISKTGFYFDTVITVTLYDASATEELEECFSLAEKYENMLSATREGSDIWNLNHAVGNATEVSEETAALIQKAVTYSELSNGAFDITIGELSSLWNFKENDDTVPSEASITSALATVGYQNIQIDGNEITLTNPDTQIDLGGIAKGYIADQMKSYLNQKGITEGIINLGGNILTIGPKSSGDSYHIGIQKPFSEDGSSIASVKITDASLVSSGVYERCFKKDGVLYHHILNPKTGYPYDNHLLGVTIITQNSADADALSTTCFALGLEDGMKLIEKTPDTEAVFITDDYELHTSSGIGDKIPLEKE